jgi:hypothetical protein
MKYMNEASPALLELTAVIHSDEVCLTSLPRNTHTPVLLIVSPLNKVHIIIGLSQFGVLDCCMSSADSWFIQNPTSSERKGQFELLTSLIHRRRPIDCIFRIQYVIRNVRYIPAFPHQHARELSLAF